jgi:hypothetical protein
MRRFACLSYVAAVGIGIGAGMIAAQPVAKGPTTGLATTATATATGPVGGLASIPSEVEVLTADLRAMMPNLAIEMRSADRCTLTFTTTSARLVRFLPELESAKRPSHIEAITIATPKQGQDNLRVEIDLRLNTPADNSRIPVTECMTALSEIFPREPNSIWVVTLGFNKSQVWEMDCRYSEERYAQQLLAAMEADARFVKPRRTTDIGRNEPDAKIRKVRFIFGYDVNPPATATTPTTVPAASSQPQDNR